MRPWNPPHTPIILCEFHALRCHIISHPYFQSPIFASISVNFRLAFSIPFRCIPFHYHRFISIPSTPPVTLHRRTAPTPMQLAVPSLHPAPPNLQKRTLSLPAAMPWTYRSLLMRAQAKTSIHTIHLYLRWPTIMRASAANLTSSRSIHKHISSCRTNFSNFSKGNAILSSTCSRKYHSARRMRRRDWTRLSCASL